MIHICQTQDDDESNINILFDSHCRYHVINEILPTKEDGSVCIFCYRMNLMNLTT